MVWRWIIQETSDNIMYALAESSAAAATIGYIIFDIRMTQVGLFQSAGMSVLAVLLAIVVIAAIALMAYTAKMVIKNTKRK